VLTGRAERRVTPEFRGGKLRIEWREHGAKVASHVMMTGEALKVFSGEVGVGDGELVPVVA
jgi:diaminopimelate epimerase